MPRRPRVIVIGLDGGTFDLIRPWVAEGHLPAIGRLLADGASGVLRSTIQPLSPPAWTSLLTGVNPGAHGIFNFYEHDPSTYELKLVNAKRRLRPSLAAHLSRLGRRVLVANVPMTYPPERVNGYFIAGFDTPDESCAFTWPPSLRDELTTRHGYRIDCYLREFQGPDVAPEETMRRFSESLVALEKTRTRALLDLLDRERFDFALLTFTATDRAAHHFWGPMEAGEAAVGPIAHTLREVYRAVDAGIAAILERADPETTVLLVSDHGTCAFRRVFFLNNWLAREGYLSEDRRAAGGVSGTLRFAVRAGMLGVRAVLPRPVRALLKSRSAALRQTLGRELGSPPIAWDRTRAFAEHLSGNVFVNTRGAYGRGTVAPGAERERLAEEIRAKLAALVDPATGRPFCVRVWRREELYRGAALEKAPDVLMELADGYEVVSDLHEGPATLFRREPLLFRDVERGFLSGAHTHEGILVAAGRGIRPGPVRGAQIVDVAPTVCALLGVPPLPGVDGRVLGELLAADAPVTAHA